MLTIRKILTCAALLAVQICFNYNNSAQAADRARGGAPGVIRRCQLGVAQIQPRFDIPLSSPAGVWRVAGHGQTCFYTSNRSSLTELTGPHFCEEQLNPQDASDATPVSTAVFTCQGIYNPTTCKREVITPTNSGECGGCDKQSGCNACCNELAPGAAAACKTQNGCSSKETVNDDYTCNVAGSPAPVKPTRCGLCTGGGQCAACCDSSSYSPDPDENAAMITACKNAC